MTAGQDVAPVLVACSHGTVSPDGRRAMAGLRAQIAALRPGLEVAPAYVDVEHPPVAEVVRGLTARGRRCIVVPLLLSAGYHVRIDIAAAVAGTNRAAVAARQFGPDPALVDVLSDRLAQASAGPHDAVLLAAAGSSDPRAVDDVEQVAAALGRRLDRPVTVCFLTAAEPTVTTAVSRAVTATMTTSTTSAAVGKVTVATYLLSPGLFADRLTELATGAGAARVTAPLAGHPALAELALRRYDDARLAPGTGLGIP